MSPPADADPPLRPSLLWAWLGGVLLVVGVLVAIGWFVSGFVDLRDDVRDFARLRLSEDGATVDVDRPGGQVVYVEGGSGRDVRVDRIEVVGPDGEPLAVSPYRTELTYAIGGHDGEAVATFDATTAGEHLVRAAPGTGRPGIDLAVGPSVAGQLVRTVVGGLLIGAAAFVLATALIAVTLVRRSSERRRRRRSAGDWPYTRPVSEPGGPLPPPQV